MHQPRMRQEAETCLPCDPEAASRGWANVIAIWYCTYTTSAPNRIPVVSFEVGPGYHGAYLSLAVGLTCLNRTETRLQRPSSYGPCVESRGKIPPPASKILGMSSLQAAHAHAHAFFVCVFNPFFSSSFSSSPPMSPPWQAKSRPCLLDLPGLSLDPFVVITPVVEKRLIPRQGRAVERYGQA
ncbi:hypothetical protein LX32DRAFT_278786 [Colletotrichum zoysiae]|uniref:Uncharacterized protein n=1 Tax=Colletotrichum zoysiae TaxID=1216348 RepID=A0AAD9LT88_9PEZI|nr:hypothetical protein LX32DRAFT_278786 [Colletotrichum zoysiae]